MALMSCTQLHLFLDGFLVFQPRFHQGQDPEDLLVSWALEWEYISQWSLEKLHQRWSQWDLHQLSSTSIRKSRYICIWLYIYIYTYICIQALPVLWTWWCWWCNCSSHLSGAGNCVDSNPFPSNLSINLCDIEEAKFTIQSHHWLW